MPIRVLASLALCSVVVGGGCVPVVAFDVPLSAETTVEGGGVLELFISASSRPT